MDLAKCKETGCYENAELVCSFHKILVCSGWSVSLHDGCWIKEISTTERVKKETEIVYRTLKKVEERGMI